MRRNGLFRVKNLATLLFCTIAPAFAQKAALLSQVKTLYVDPLETGRGSAAMRARIIERLDASGKIHVVSSPGIADAVLKGNGTIWSVGSVSLSLHPSQANRRAVFDGFLSVEIHGKGGSTLWSYLVTPSKFSMKPITSDLADQIVERLLAGLDAEPSQPALPVEATTARVTLNGAGATFPLPLYQKWIESFEQGSPNITIHYDPVGSEAGIRLLTDGTSDFAGSDMPLSDQTMAGKKSEFRQFASVLGAVVPIYNLRDIKNPLNFTPEALVGIYLGTVTRWNDPAIQAANRGVTLPASQIIVVHRSDGSGTTFVWSDYLSKVSPEWKQKVGADTTISWPIGRGAERNEGVASLVRQTPNSIGYVELIYAIQHELRFGAVRNSSGTFIKADLASVTAAAAQIAESGNPDFRVSITNAAGKTAYPIATFTWLLLPADGGQGAKRSGMIEFLRWALTYGQKQCSGLGYAPLPGNVANQELQGLSNLQ